MNTSQCMLIVQPVVYMDGKKTSHYSSEWKVVSIVPWTEREQLIKDAIRFEEQQLIAHYKLLRVDQIVEG